MAMTLDAPASKSGSRRRGSRYRTRAEINVTPFVDVMLVLLIVFMVSAPLLVSGVDLTLPKTRASAMAGSGERISVSVRADGGIFIQQEPYDLLELGPKLRSVAAAQARVEPGAVGEAMAEALEQRIYVRAEDTAYYGLVANVLVEIKSAGFTNFGIVTDPQQEFEALVQAAEEPAG